MNKITDWIKKHIRSVFLFIILGFLWSWVLVVDIAELSGGSAIGYVMMVMIYAIVVCLSFFIYVHTFKKIHSFLQKPRWIYVFRIVFVLAALELLLAALLNAFWMGKGGSWDSVIPFNSLTPMIMHSPLAPLTRIFGYFGTSAVIILGIILVTQKSNWRRIAVSYWIGILLFSALLSAIYTQPNGSTVNITLVSDTINDPLSVEAGDSDIVLLPEYGLDDVSSDNSKEIFASSDKDILFTGTQQSYSTAGIQNKLVYGSTHKGFLVEQDKRRLIPGGEYLPISLELLTRTLQPSIYDNFQATRAVSKGEQEPEPYRLPGGEHIANAPCSSIMNPEDYRKMTLKGATILSNSASLEIFRGSRIFEFYHDGFAKFMAVSNARPFVQSAFNWKAFALDHNGKTVASINPQSAVTVTVTANNKLTPYSVLGEWVSYVGIIYIVFLGIKKLLTRIRSPKSLHKK